MKIILVNASNAHISHTIPFWQFTNSLGNDNNNYIYVISKAEKGYICNTLTESLRNQLKIKEANSKMIMGDHITKYKQH